MPWRSLILFGTLLRLAAGDAVQVFSAIELIRQGCEGIAGLSTADLLPSFLGPAAAPDRAPPERPEDAASAGEAAAALLEACDQLDKQSRKLLLADAAEELWAAGFAERALAEEEEEEEEDGSENVTENVSAELAQELAAEPEKGWLVPGFNVSALAACLIGTSVLALLALLWEACFLRSTLVFSHVNRAIEYSDQAWRKARVAVTKSLSGRRGVKLDRGEDVARPTARRQALEKAFSHDHVRSFWDKVEAFLCGNLDSKVGGRVRAGSTGRVDMVGFTRREFPADIADGKARIAIQRRGACLDNCVVSVCTEESLGSSFQAKAGKDYEHVDTELSFGPGEKLKYLEVPLKKSGTIWSQWFRVKLRKVVSGNAVLGGPTVAHWEQEGESLDIYARVVVLKDQDMFPSSIPEFRRKNPFWLAFYHFRERINDRKEKYWKAMAGILYASVHDVVVVELVRKLALDWATDPEEHQADGQPVYIWIFVLALVYFLSEMLTRWGDHTQTKNRGRTGGCRQVHRKQLVAKLMMMDYEEQCAVEPHRWFYAAMQNVEVMTMSGFWQSFMLAQSLLAMVLSVVVLLCLQFLPKPIGRSGLFRFVNFVPALGVVAIVPVALYVISRRFSTTAEYLQKRMDGEAAWMETFSWLAHCGPSLASFGPRELSNLEIRLSKESKYFVERHWEARDHNNDGNWVTEWLSSLAFTFIFLWGGVRLTRARELDDDGIFSAGDFVLLLSLYLKFGKYLWRVNSSMLQLQASAVSIDRVASLLNLPERQALRLVLEEERQIAMDPSVLEALPKDHIEMQGVQFFEMHGLDGTPKEPNMGMGALAMPKGKKLEIPLGRVVRVSGEESQCKSFMALIAGQLRPSCGTILKPPAVWTVLLTPIPPGIPHHSEQHPSTVLQALKLPGAPEDVASRLAHVLGLDPGQSYHNLGAGQAQLVALARALLRDPEVLVVGRALAFVPLHRRAKVTQLLRAWQRGGGTRQLMNWLLGEETEKAVIAESTRTLIITAEDMDAESTDVIYDLDKLLVPLGRFFVGMNIEERDFNKHVNEAAAKIQRVVRRSILNGAEWKGRSRKFDLMQLLEQLRHALSTRNLSAEYHGESSQPLTMEVSPPAPTNGKATSKGPFHGVHPRRGEDSEAELRAATTSCCPWHPSAPWSQ